MEFYTLSPEQIQELRKQFVIEINRIFLKSGMSMNAVAGEARSELLYALRGERRPSEENLMNWCDRWYRAGVISGTEATHLMHLAGYPTPAQRLEALTATTEHRAIVSVNRVNTEDLPPLPGQRYR